MAYVSTRVFLVLYTDLINYFDPVWPPSPSNIQASKTFAIHSNFALLAALFVNFETKRVYGMLGNQNPLICKNKKLFKKKRGEVKIVFYSLCIDKIGGMSSSPVSSLAQP